MDEGRERRERVRVEMEGGEVGDAARRGERYRGVCVLEGVCVLCLFLREPEPSARDGEALLYAEEGPLLSEARCHVPSAATLSRSRPSDRRRFVF